MFPILIDQGNGDMLFHPVGLSDPIRVQGAFVTDGEVEAVMEFLKKQTGLEFRSLG